MAHRRESAVDEALAAWGSVVGDRHVSLDAAALDAVATATFRTTQRAAAIVRPANASEVQECLRIANRYATPIYPVSGGKNWGYGSRVPPQDGSVILDLSRLDRITDFDEELSYVTVEAGVTFRQVFEFLRERKSELMLNVTGSSPDSSLVGNTVERGLGFGPYADRFSHVCGLEVVLPTGELLRTGFERFDGAPVAKVHRWGVGPWLDGLFTQSNLGIVTRLTTWLSPRPRHFLLGSFTARSDAELGSVIGALRPIFSSEFIDLRVGNSHVSTLNTAHMPSTPMRRFVQRRRGPAAWLGFMGVHAASAEELAARRALIVATVGKAAGGIRFLDPKASSWLAKPLSLVGLALPSSGPFTGEPQDNWRYFTYGAKPHMPQDADPDRDRCGLIWCCPVFPFQSAHVRRGIEVIERVTGQHRLRASVNLRFVSRRSIDAITALVYDRDEPGVEERAMACIDALHRELGAAGYLPYRLPLPGMGSLPKAHPGWASLLGTLKAALDPNGVLAPGRYEFANDRIAAPMPQED